MNTPKITFVGRETEISCFQTILTSQEKQTQVLYVEGKEGGIGKTKLLEKYQEICSESGFPYTQIIDFYDTDDQVVMGLRNRIATELSSVFSILVENNTQLHPFKQYWNAYAARMVRESNSEPAEASTYEQKADEQFVEDYNQIANWFAAQGRRPVLFFDTLDAVQDLGDVNRWFFNILIPKINNTIVVFAGRNKLPESILFTPAILKIEKFSLLEIEGYFRNRKIQIDEFRGSPVAQYIDLLTEGNPLLISLVADWLLTHPNQDLRDLLGHANGVDVGAKKQFRRRLIGDVLRLDLPEEYETVWYMSHIYHRFNADILARIKRISQEDADAIITNLSQFPFIKYRPQSRSYQLHDVMRDLVREYVMDQVEDVDKHLRRDLSKSMIEYYDQEIAKSPEFQFSPDLHVIRAEQLYHYFYVDLNDGFARFNGLSKEADGSEDVQFSDLLLGNAKWYYQDLNPKQKAIYDMYKGWLTKNLGNPAAAAQILRECLDVLKRLNDPIVDVVTNSLGHTYKELGQFDDARRMYREALKLNKSSARDPHERMKIEAQISNNLGNLSRLQGMVDEAHQYSMISLILRLRLNDDSLDIAKDIANSYYYLGLIVREFGDNNGALRYFDKAETEYSRLPSDDISRRKGIANITRSRAYICNHVREHEEAIKLAKESYRILAEEICTPSADLADALDILGRLIRDKAADDYAKNRISDENSALAKRDETLREAEAYIERGYRMAQRIQDKFKEAESILSYVRLFAVKGDYVKSLSWYDQGIEICRPRQYFLLLSYFEAFAGSNYFNLKQYDDAFEKFAWRALYASRCRAMELGMTMDSIANYLERLKEPQLMAKYADYLIRVWQSQPKWKLEQHFPQIIEFCKDIKGLATL